MKFFSTGSSERIRIVINILYLAARKRVLALARGRYFVISRFSRFLLVDIFNYVDRQVEAYGLYEKEQLVNMEGLISRYDIPVFLDIGAHWGLYGLYLSSRPLLRSLEIIAFEPDPRNHGQLRANIFLNQLHDHIRAESIALSSESGFLEFVTYPDENRGRSCVKPGAGLRVPCTTLDAYCAGQSGSPLAIKIDAEGHEMNILHGAIDTLSGRACVVQVEVKSQVGSAVHDLFQGLGYRLISQLGEDHVYVSPLL